MMTIDDLKDFMVKNCFSFEEYSIKGNFIYEGYILERHKSTYSWIYTEKGNKEIIKTFYDESEAVQYAYNIIKNDKYAYSHLISSTNEISQMEKITSILKDRKINYWVEELPLKPFPLFRIYIVGCDINKVQDLKV